MIVKWHRLFGLFLTDFFTDSPFEVEIEKDLSLKQQYLDIVILRKDHEGSVENLPDGLENLRNHNLLSYKSHHEPFDAWAFKELIGHYVNYRKQVSPSFDDLLPEVEFQLYAVSTRFPQKLAKQIQLQPIKSGVYDVLWGVDKVRLIVLSEIADGEHNAIWRLFSVKPDVVLQAREQYRVHCSEMSDIIYQLLENYQQEKFIMSYTVQDFHKEYIRGHLDLLPTDEVLKKYSVNDRLKGLSSDDRLKGLSPDEIFKHFSLEEMMAWLEKQKASQ